MTAKGKTEVQALFKEIEAMEAEIGQSIGTQKLAQSIDLLAEMRAVFDAGCENNEQYH